MKSELERFLFENIELEKLESKLNEFNVFKVLGLVDYEIKHSNFLAWLLNPKENHGIGNYFLKKIVSAFLYRNPHEFLSFIEAESLTFSDVIIKREWKNIDILIIINEKNKSFIFTIENKIWSTEHNSQLSKYKTIIEEEFNDNEKHMKFYIYLSPDSNRNDNLQLPWSPFYYSSIVDVLGQTIDYHREIVNSQIISVIYDYYSVLNSYVIMSDEKVKELCKIIWQNHKDAIDTLIANKPNVIADFAEVFIEKLNKIGLNKKKNIEFKTKEFDRLNSEIYLGYYILKDDNRLKIQIYIQKRNNELLANKVIGIFSNINNCNIKENIKLTDGSSGNMVYSKDLISVENQIKFIIEVQELTMESFNKNCEEFFKDMKLFEEELKKIEL